MDKLIWVIALATFTNQHFGNATNGQPYRVPEQVAEELEEMKLVRIMTKGEAEEAQAVFNQAGNGLAAAPQDAQTTPTSAKGGKPAASSQAGQVRKPAKFVAPTKKAKTGAS